MFRTISSKKHRSLIVLILLVIVTVSGFSAFLAARATDHNIRTQLANRAATVAALLDKDDILDLTGQAKDTDNPAYLRLKQSLAGIKKANGDIKTLYIAEWQDDGVHFYIDSEQPDSRLYSPPGEAYADATPLFKSMFTADKAAVEGPTGDDFGSWVSGLAPIRNYAGDRTLAVLGIDIDAGYYYSAVASSAALPLLLGLLLVGIVITYEIRRRREERQLELRSELVSVASHELRSPLSGIRWAAESMAATLQGPEKAMAQRIFKSSTNLQAGIEDVLEISRAGSGKKRKLKISDCNMTVLIGQIFDTQQLIAAEKKVELVLDDSWKPDVTISCDANAMKRALYNVISNAIKYTGPDTTVTVHYDGSDKEHHIRVTDQGIGIPEEEQAKVFGGFYRASNAIEHDVQGTGLGLYLTRSVLEQHGGTISLESTVNRGTIVTLVLPRSQK